MGKERPKESSRNSEDTGSAFEKVCYNFADEAVQQLLLASDPTLLASGKGPQLLRNSFAI
jgi:hypothetical protein